VKRASPESITTALAACRIRGKLKEARSVVLFARMAQGPSAPAIIGTLADDHDQPRAAVVMDSGLSLAGCPGMTAQLICPTSERRSILAAWRPATREKRVLQKFNFVRPLNDF
jgi:hypothetical protein